MWESIKKYGRSLKEATKSVLGGAALMLMIPVSVALMIVLPDLGFPGEVPVKMLLSVVAAGALSGTILLIGGVVHCALLTRTEEQESLIPGDHSHRNDTELQVVVSKTDIPDIGNSTAYAFNLRRSPNSQGTDEPHQLREGYTPIPNK